MRPAALKVLTAIAGGFRTPSVHQGEHAECGLAALAILMGHHGIHVPVAELRARGGSVLLGSSLKVLRDLARGFGFEASTHRVEPADLVALGLPLIVHHRFIHFVVVEAVGRCTVRLNDPLQGPMTIRADVFAEDFTGFALRLRPSATMRRSGRAFSSRRRYVADVGPAHIPLAAAALITVAGTIAVVDGVAGLARTLVNPAVRPSWLFAELVALGVVADAAAGRLAARSLVGCATGVIRDVASQTATLSRPIVLARGLEPLRRRLLAPIALAEDGPVLAALASLSWLVVTAAGPVVAAAPGWCVAIANLTQLWLVVATVRRRGSALCRYGEASLPVSGLGEARYARPEPWLIGGRGDALFQRVAGLHARAAAAALRAAVDGARLDILSHAVELAKLIMLVRLVATAREPSETAGALTLLGLAALSALDLSRIRRGLHTIDVETALHALDDAPPPRVSVDPLRCAGAGLVIAGVSWRPSPLHAPIVENIHATVGAGQVLCINGRPGSGRTTLARLSAGWLMPSVGRVTFDGITATDLPDGTAILLDDAAPLDSGSLRDAIRCGRAIEDADILAAFDAVGLAETVDSRGGLDLAIDGDRPSFSGGEIARLALVRTLCRRPRLLILDGTLDSVEPALAAEIASRIVARGIALVLVSNRRETLALADALVTLPSARA